MVFIHNGILYSYKTEGNIATSDSMDGFWGHYNKWKKSQTVNDKTVWSLLYVESKKKERERERTDWWLPEKNGESWGNRLSESKHKEKQN